MMNFPKRSWIRRATQIARILRRFGFASAMHALGFEALVPKRPQGEEDSASRGLELPVRLRLALEEIGPAAVKLGQTLASRSDLLPLDYIHELRKLQDEVPPVPFEEAAAVISADLGQPLEELFAEFDPQPAASASLSQVHFATLRDGSEVAVKVMRPGVEQAVETDLEIMVWAAHQAERYSVWCRRNHLGELAEEMAYLLRRELNLTIEGHNADLLREQVEDDPRGAIPSIYWPLSSRRVLTMERMAGAKVTDDRALAELQIDRPRAATHLAGLMLEQILEHGFFHSDPHGGNLLIAPGEEIVFLDCGSAAYLPRELREGLVQLLAAVLEEDAREVCDQLTSIGAATPETDWQALLVDVRRMLGHYGTAVSSADSGMGEMLDQMMTLVLRHQIRVPPAFPALVKTLVVVEGACLELDPEFSFRESAREVARLLVWRSLRPSRMAEHLGRTVRELQRHAMLLPRQLSHVLAKAQAGALKVRVEHEGLERPMNRLAAIMDRLAVSVLVSALILAAALIVASGRTLHLAGVADFVVYAIGVLGLVLGGWLLISIIRSGRL